MPALKRRFLEAQTICHPDSWASKNPGKQDIAQGLSARVNHAYQTLLDPLSRAEYILERNHVPIAEGDQVEDMMFMAEIMEARETIDEAHDTAEVEALFEENEDKINATVKDLEFLIGGEDWVSAKAAAIRLRYLQGRRLIMQSNPARALASSSSPFPPHTTDPTSSVKRSLSQQTSPVQPVPSTSKVPRVDANTPISQPFSSSRRTFQTTTPGQGPGMFQNFHGSSGKSSRQGNYGHRPGPSGHGRFPSGSKQKGKGSNAPKKPMFEGPVHNEAYITHQFSKPSAPLKQAHVSTPKASLGNFAMVVVGSPPQYTSQAGTIDHENKRLQVWRTTATLALDPPISGTGDSPEKKESERLAALSIVYQLHDLGLLDNPKQLRPTTAQPSKDVTLSDRNTVVDYEKARSFMDYYCRRFDFGKPDLNFEEIKSGPLKWEAVLTVGDSRIGVGKAATKKNAQVQCYLDVVQYLESCDPQLWKDFVAASKTGEDLGKARAVRLQISDPLDEMVRDLCVDIRHSQLYRNRPAKQSSSTVAQAGFSVTAPGSVPRYVPPRNRTTDKSERLLAQRQQYLVDPRMEKMRNLRASLPVYTRSQDLLNHIRDNDVTICMAATGSGKTSQIPQIILDDYIERGEGAKCNVICTQPRRLAAISVADRVSKERGEPLGASIGYQVRFEHKLPEEHGSVTFCTTGVFLKKLQSALSGGNRSMEDVTHIVVDEVHERDVDTDLLLVVLKRLLEDRKARNKPIKVILMSATIDATLFQQYFPDEKGQPAKVLEIPGRTFPVTKHHLDDFLPKVIAGTGRWLIEDESVAEYVHRELGQATASSLGVRLKKQPSNTEEELDLPYPLIAATISHVLKESDDGHVLVFLPGWDEISATQRALETLQGRLPINVHDKQKFSIHLLHSTIPLAEQQVIFEPPPPGVRRIILSTNIAETSVTIPDVVYVIDTAKIKEVRYDPERHMSSLVTAWVGKSNLNQRAGRAGRHRSGEYYGIIGKAHADSLHPHQAVEMKRIDLSNVVMHVKALNFPGMSVEQVLAETIEPPAPERVLAAVADLQMVGALDGENLTSLGRVLLALPVDAQMGRLVLYGSFFKCLDQALTLAAILTNRDPFVCPMHLKAEASAKKNSWAPEEFRSDALCTLRAYNAWWALQSRGEYISANRFCIDNFLAKPTLLLIQKIKAHLLQALDSAGVLAVSAGGQARRGYDRAVVPPELNTNGECLPLLAALIAIASQPKFAIRTGDRILRTARDKTTFIHPSSVNHRKSIDKNKIPTEEKQIYAFLEKRRNATQGGSPQTYLVTTTRLDPLTYMLFGAYDLAVSDRGLLCDNWLPIVGNVEVLDNIQRLKGYMEGSMLRVFEGISKGGRNLGGHHASTAPREDSEDEYDDAPVRNGKLSSQEVRDLDLMTRDIVNILTLFSEERMSTQSRSNSRPATPMDSPLRLSTRLPGGIQTGYNTPYQSRPGTPSRLSRRLERF